jgi:hypothetical protein
VHYTPVTPPISRKIEVNAGPDPSSRLLNAAPSAGVSIGDVSHRARGHYRRSTMLKKLFISAAAAAAVSVPLAGAAWADPRTDPGPSSRGTPSGNGIGQGGVPKKTGSYFDSVSAANPGLPNLNPNG